MPKKDLETLNDSQEFPTAFISCVAECGHK